MSKIKATNDRETQQTKIFINFIKISNNITFILITNRFNMENEKEEQSSWVWKKDEEKKK